MADIGNSQMKSMIEEAFRTSGISSRVEVRSYPEEVIFVVSVPQIHLADAARLGNQLDEKLAAAGIKGFVTVRGEKIGGETTVQTVLGFQGVHDPRSAKLAALLTARSRTSEALPSLTYIPDVQHNISSVLTPRHHLVFGRRGAGKTALLLEARRRVQERGDQAVWVNIQTYRREPTHRLVAFVFARICEAVQAHFGEKAQAPSVLVDAQALSVELLNILSSQADESARTTRLVPRVNSLLKRFLGLISHDLFIFLDDFHYVDRSSQPEVLDLIHGAVRDANAWLKVATIRHLSRWFVSNPPTGLETGHDTDVINLDLSLEDPARAREFLHRLAQSYADPAGLESIDQVYSPDSIDRLVLASGAVPRDFLTLCSSSLVIAKGRPQARVVGMQDVNRAAGEAKKVKLNEVEEDIAAAGELRTLVPELLALVRRFCLEEKRFSFFRIDFHDKEQRRSEYAVFQALLDLRLMHLIHSSLSDEHQAGRKSEVFMLDLSQYSGERLKKGLRVLELRRGQLVLRLTGSVEAGKVGDSPRRLLGMLRRGPMFDLGRLSSLTVKQA